MKITKKARLEQINSELDQLFCHAENGNLAGMADVCYSINGIYNSIPLQEVTMEIMACIWQVTRHGFNRLRLQACIKNALLAIAVNNEHKAIAKNFSFSPSLIN